MTKKPRWYKPAKLNFNTLSAIYLWLSSCWFSFFNVKYNGTIHNTTVSQNKKIVVPLPAPNVKIALTPSQISIGLESNIFSPISTNCFFNAFGIGSASTFNFFRVGDGFNFDVHTRCLNSITSTQYTRFLKSPGDCETRNKAK
jgi:hypothetical protein